MRELRDRLWFPPLCFCIAALTAAIASVPGEAVAGIAASRATDPAISREQDLERVQRFLERKIVQRKLRDYGVSPGLAMDKIRQIDDKELHLLASRVEGIPDGGAMVGVDPGVLILALAVLTVVIVIIFLGAKFVVNEMLHRPSPESVPSPSAVQPVPAE